MSGMRSPRPWVTVCRSCLAEHRSRTRLTPKDSTNSRSLYQSPSSSARCAVEQSRPIRYSQFDSVRPRRQDVATQAHRRFSRHSSSSHKSKTKTPSVFGYGAIASDASQIWQIYGANTGVGKTIVSTGLLRHWTSRGPARYIKPVSTGSDDEADISHINRFCPAVQVQCLQSYDIPTSPHVAAKWRKIQGGAEPFTDEQLRQELYDAILSHSRPESMTVVECAGGVLSPGPNGTVQADLYRPLRLPVILVGDHRLGGISSTISAWESLHLRGYDVDIIVMFRDPVHDNAEYSKDYFGERVWVIDLPAPPPLQQDKLLDQFALEKYYASLVNDEAFVGLCQHLSEQHSERQSKLKSLAQRGHDHVWHPFMQHTERTVDSLMVVDSAYDDDFQVFDARDDDARDERCTNVLAPLYDGSASWWTQGLGHGNPKLALTVAHAAGRYGHVMFANAAHEPAVSLAQALIDGDPNEPDRIKHKYAKCFFSDNGSTGIEVALKMALRAASNRYQWSRSDKIQVLGLKGSYHGDTIGAMNSSEPNVYNEKVEWYSGQGQWLDFPQVRLSNGKWLVVPPVDDHSFGGIQEFDSIEAIFDLDARKDKGKQYAAVLDAILQKMVANGAKLGALIMEPVILGAGGMLFADPLFQHELSNASQRLAQGKSKDTNGSNDEWSGMPVIADEVFTGLYRLNVMRSSDHIQIRPDIVVNAKLLTGGLLPLATTLASQSIFDEFLSDDKSDALLHGHSYTAHALGCEVALQSLMELSRVSTPKQISSSRDSEVSEVSSKRTSSIWLDDEMQHISVLPNIDSVRALGTVLAIEFKDELGAGYKSTAAAAFRDKLYRQNELDLPRVHSRVLGNVLYFIAAPTAPPSTISRVRRAIMAVLKS